MGSSFTVTLCSAFIRKMAILLQKNCKIGHLHFPAIYWEYKKRNIQLTTAIYSAIRSFSRFCKQFSEISTVVVQLPCCLGKQGELSENCLQNLGNDLMADSVRYVQYSIHNWASLYCVAAWCNLLLQFNRGENKKPDRVY